MASLSDLPFDIDLVSELDLLRAASAEPLHLSLHEESNETVELALSGETEHNCHQRVNAIHRWIQSEKEKNHRWIPMLKYKAQKLREWAEKYGEEVAKRELALSKWNLRDAELQDQMHRAELEYCGSQTLRWAVQHGLNTGLMMPLSDRSEEQRRGFTLSTDE